MPTPTIRVPIVAVDKFTAPIRLFTQRVNAMTAPIDNISKHMAKAQHAVNGFGAALARPFKQVFGGPMKFIGGSAAVLGTIATGAGAAGLGIFNLAKATADYAEELDRSAFKLGLNVGGLQKLRYAATMTKTDIETFDISMGRLTKSIGEAMSGDVKKRRLFGILGIDLNKTKDTQAVFLQLSNTLSKIKNTGTRNMVLMELFGKGGIGMANMFRGGRVELERLMKERESFGIISSADIQKSEQFQTEWRKFGAVMEGVRNTIGLELMPTMSQGMVNLSQLVIKNKDNIINFTKRLGEFFTPERIQNIAAGIQAVAGVLGSYAEAAAKAYHFTEKVLQSLADFTTPRMKQFEYDPGNKSVHEAAPQLPSSNFGTGYGVSGDVPWYVQRQRENAAAVAANVAPKNSVITEKNQALLHIKISKDGGVQTSMLGGLGDSVRLGWSMVN